MLSTDVPGTLDLGSATSSWSCKSVWGEQRELQESRIVAGKLTGSNGMCTPTGVERKAAVRSDRRHYSLNSKLFLLRMATIKTSLLQAI